MSERLRAALTNLARARQVEASMKESLATAEQRIAEFLEANAPELVLYKAEATVNLGEIRRCAVEADAEVRTIALAKYEAEKEKQMDAGVVAAVGQNLIYDQAEALNWAKSHQLYLTLDAPSFEKAAKATPREFPFVRAEEKVTIRIPSDLSALIDESPEIRIPHTRKSDAAIDVRPDSSQVKRIQYDGGPLVVTFNGGAVYEYEGVPVEVVHAFIEAPSIGGFLAANIKGKYEYKKVSA